MSNLLSQQFLSKYSDFPSHMTELGKFIFYRTYSRWLEDKQRRETWKETVRRAVEYNCSLVPNVDQEEAEKLFDNMFNLRQFCSGRTLWVGGTEASKRFPASNFNCSFVVIDDFEAIYDLFYLLMIGTGVGFRILKSDVEKLPRMRDDVKLKISPYRQMSGSRSEVTTLEGGNQDLIIKVGDSKEGWASAMYEFLKVFYHNSYRNIKTVQLYFDHVRPKGERLKTFGGLASGPEPLMKMFKKVHKVLTTDEYSPKPENGKLRPIHLLDICNIIAQGIVVGGVRRSAQIALISPDDEECLNAKKGIVGKPDMDHRYLSNNSVFYEEKPTWDQLKKHFETLRDEGEPGFINAESARKRRENFNGVNPCAEVLLDNKGLCNLTTINVMAFVKDGTLDIAGLLEAQRLSARMAVRMTNVDLELYKWDYVQKRDRLTGCSLTGWKDMVEAVGLNEVEENWILKNLKDTAISTANRYADELGINRPLLVTTVKPEGSLSLLAGGVSPGLHHSHSPYYIRRIRINANDPLLKVVEELGWQVHNEIGEGVEITDENGNKIITPVLTKVIDFPVKSPTSKTKYDVSSLEQLETYYKFQQHYTEHNSSITVTVKEKEWEDVARNIYENWDQMIGVSFLKLDGHVYDLAPYEAISEEEYYKLKSKMKPFDHNLLLKYESGEDHEVESDCEGGVCPVR